MEYRFDIELSTGADVAEALRGSRGRHGVEIAFASFINALGEAFDERIDRATYRIGVSFIAPFYAAEAAETRAEV